MKKQSQFLKKRLQHLANKEQVKEAFNWTELEYNTFQYELGYAFLNFIFPSNDPMYQPYVKLYERDRLYWRWWIAEWNVWQNTTLAIVNNRKMSMEFFKEDMRMMLEADFIHASFQNHYLKYLQFELNESRSKSSKKEVKKALKVA